MTQLIHLNECEPGEHPGWKKTTFAAAGIVGATLCPQTQYMIGELLPDETVWVETLAAFTPRSGIPPFWVHTIELDRGTVLAGTVVVVAQQHLPAVLGMTGYDGADLIVHQQGDEVWLRLNRDQTIHLINAARKQMDNDPDYVPDLYDELALIRNVILEDERD